MSGADQPTVGAAVDPALDERERSYARVLGALSQDLGAEPDMSAALDASYRQHVVVETLRDLEAARSRFMLLQAGLTGEFGAEAGHPAT